MKITPSAKMGFRAGVVGGVTMSVVMMLFRVFNLAELNLEMALGGFYTKTIGSGTWILGFITHLMIAGGVGILFASIFQFTGRANWKIGAALGAGFFVVVGLLLPLVPNAQLEFFAWNIKDMSFTELLVAHLFYGATVGLIYGQALRERIISIDEKDHFATSNLADSLGQGSTDFEEYKKKKAS